VWSTACSSTAPNEPYTVLLCILHAGLGKMWQQEGAGLLFRGLQPAFAYQIAVNGTRLGGLGC
jgi:hypothetical protein